MPLTIPGSGTIAGAANLWPAVSEGAGTSTAVANTLQVAAGTALDLSYLTANPSSSLLGQRGHGFNWTQFHTPSASEVDDYVAQIKRNGHSFVRFHGLENILYGNTLAAPNGGYACAYDPGTRDNFWRFVAKLSDAGIKIKLSWLFNQQGMLPSSITGGADRFSPQNSAIAVPLHVLLNDDGNIWAHWRNCVDTLFGQVVSYYASPKTILSDPNVVIVELLNESNLENFSWGTPTFVFGSNPAPYMGLAWQAWQYANLGSAPYGTSIDSRAGGNGTKTQRYAKFLTDTMQAAKARMQSYLAVKGFGGKVVLNNYIPTLFADIVRAEGTAAANDIHVYADLSDMSDQFANRSMIGDRFWWWNRLNSHFRKGLRTCSSEMGIGSGNQYGYEMPLVYAYAAFQDHDFISQFAHMDNAFNFDDGRILGANFQYHFNCGHDAVKDLVQAGASRIGAFLFLRGDVSRGAREVGLVLRKSNVLNASTPWDVDWSHDEHDMALVKRVRLVHEADLSGATYIGPGAAPDQIFDPLVDGSVALSTRVSTWRGAGKLASGNATNVGAGIFETEGEQIRIDTANRAARVQTPRSHVLIWDSPSAAMQTDRMVIEQATPQATLAAHDLSTNASATLGTSGSVLLVHLSAVRASKPWDTSSPVDFVSNGTVQWPYLGYSDVSAVGVSGGYINGTALPMRVRGSIVVAKMKLAAGSWRLFRLNLKGQRVGEVPTETTSDGWTRFVLSNTDTAFQQQTIYYELAIVGPAPTPTPTPVPVPDSGAAIPALTGVADWSAVTAASGGNRWLLPSVTSPSTGGGTSTGPQPGDGTVVAVTPPRVAAIPERTALFTADDFLRAMQALLPRGRVWPRDADATQTRLLQGLVQIYDTNTARALQLLADAFPSLSVELLAEWEQTLGLPDPCAGASPTLQQRRAQVVARLVDAGGQSAAYFKSLAADLGYDVTVTSDAPFRVGQSHAGDHVGSDDWFFTWAVHAALITIGQFRSGQSAVGEPLQAWGNDVLECEIGERAPAQSIVQFKYS